MSTKPLYAPQSADDDPALVAAYRRAILEAKHSDAPRISQADMVKGKSAFFERLAKKSSHSKKNAP